MKSHYKVAAESAWPKKHCQEKFVQFSFYR
jgi:hypothetical protein